MTSFAQHKAEGEQPQPLQHSQHSQHSSDDWAAQINEMSVLASIYGGAPRFSVVPDTACLDPAQVKPLLFLQGELNVNVAEERPGAGFALVLNDAKTNEPLISRTVKHLLPVTLSFRLPAGYPSAAPPQFRLKCLWLTHDQLAHVRDTLLGMWAPQSPDVMLFRWATWLQDELVAFLGITWPLVLNTVVVGGVAAAGGDNDAANTASNAASSFTADGLLQLALDHDQAEQDRVFLETMCTCGVCFDDKIGALCFRFHRCGHQFCRDCLKGYFESQISEGAVKYLLCPQPKCGPALPNEVKKLVDPKIYERFEQLLLQQALNEMGDVIVCPRVVCGNPAICDAERKTLAQCIACRFAFCAFCHRSYHGINPCLPKDFAKLLEEYESATPDRRQEIEERYGKAMFERALQEAANQKWISLNASRCPRCHTSVQKISGCNKMTCPVCHIYFCYLCGIDLGSVNPYSHFSDVNAANCFQRLFDLDH